MPTTVSLALSKPIPALPGSGLAVVLVDILGLVVIGRRDGGRGIR